MSAFLRAYVPIIFCLSRPSFSHSQFQLLGSAINNVHEDCPDEQLIIGTRSADLAEGMAEALATRVETLVRMLCNKVPVKQGSNGTNQVHTIVYAHNIELCEYSNVMIYTLMKYSRFILPWYAYCV